MFAEEVEFRETVFVFLDELRESGSVNMFGARPVIQEMFDVTKQAASTLLGEWMRTYSERHPKVKGSS